MQRLTCVVAVLGLVACTSVPAPSPAPEELLPGGVRVFVAKKILTMEPALPEATAVAVADGRIVSVGSVESLQRWIDARGGVVDRRLEDKILMPGFIDPHVHPALPAVLTQFVFLAPDDWSLPTGSFPGARTPEAYRARLRAYAAAHDDPAVPFIAWGYHPLWHGELYRAELDALFPDTPVMLWHRSFHELVANSAALALLGVTEADFAQSHEADWARGHVWENGLGVLVQKMPFLFAPDRFGQGVHNFLAMLRRAGVTTALDMGMGLMGDSHQELALIQRAVESADAPTRIILTPIITSFLGREMSPEEALVEIESLRAASSQRVLLDRRFKLMMDGAIYSGLARFAPPGYLDGHEGVWMAPLPVTTAWARFFWSRGYQLHAHTNGDESAAALIELLRTLLDEKPRVDHRLVLEHFAYATEDQNRQLAALGAVVSANPYYQYMLADMYSEKWLGEDRGRQMVRLGSLERLGVPFALHSDAPMAPLDPLTLAWTAVNRTSINGNQNAPEERVSVEAALRAITIDAAWVMGWEDEIGSIRAGKRADFTVLEQDPFEVSPRALKDVPVWGVVFEGRVAPVAR